jgi:cytochrome P450 family 6
LRLGLIDKKVTNFFRKVVKDVMEIRQSSGNNSRRDFMQLLIELKEKGKIAIDKDDMHEVKDEETNSADTTLSKQIKKQFMLNLKIILLDLSHDDLTAQATVFFLAGFDTSSSVTSYACWELAAHPEAQDRMQQEIDEVLGKHDDKVTYEALKDMKYLDCIINGNFILSFFPVTI